MALLVLADDLARLGIERGKQTGGAVTRIVMRAPLQLAGAHGQQRRGPIQRLNLALFVHTQDQGALRRVQIQSNDVPHLVDEQRVFGQLERFAATRLANVFLAATSGMILFPAVEVLKASRTIDWERV